MGCEARYGPVTKPFVSVVAEFSPSLCFGGGDGNGEGDSGGRGRGGKITTGFTIAGVAGILDEAHAETEVNINTVTKVFRNIKGSPLRATAPPLYFSAGLLALAVKGSVRFFTLR